MNEHASQNAGSLVLLTVGVLNRHATKPEHERARHPESMMMRGREVPVAPAVAVTMVVCSVLPRYVAA
jgi:hypothetical protein